MKSTTWILLAAIVAFLVLKRIGWVSGKDAQRLLAADCIVIDVRTEGEFGNGHIPGVLNIPLDRIGTELEKEVTGKDQAILLHCFSGSRSAAACRALKKSGYGEVYNLGSYGRARRLLAKAQWSGK